MDARDGQRSGLRGRAGRPTPALRRSNMARGACLARPILVVVDAENATAVLSLEPNDRTSPSRKSLTGRLQERECVAARMVPVAGTSG